MKNNIEKFKNEKIAINTKTQEEYNELMKLLEKEDLRWEFNVKSTEINLWNIYKNETCITYDCSGDLMLEYCSKKFYKENGYEIISYQDFIKSKKFTKKDLKERWLVKTRNGKEYVVIDDYRANQIIKGKMIERNWISLEYYSENLIETQGIKELDIVEVYKPHYEKIYERKEEDCREMTVAEIEKELVKMILLTKKNLMCKFLF